jgi:hypothetical protein
MRRVEAKSKERSNSSANKQAQVDRALRNLEPRVSPMVRRSTEELVEQYHDTLRKLARQ